MDRNTKETSRVATEKGEQYVALHAERSLPSIPMSTKGLHMEMIEKNFRCMCCELPIDTSYCRELGNGTQLSEL